MDSSIKCKKTDRENFIRKNRYLVMFLTILIFLMVNGFAQAKSIKICVIDDHSGDFALPNIPKTWQNDQLFERWSKLNEIRQVCNAAIEEKRSTLDVLIYDLALSKDLLDNQKERAEHIMLVDLERNDLSKVTVKKRITLSSRRNSVSKLAIISPGALNSNK